MVIMEASILFEFTKSGSVITNSSGIAHVVFRNQIPYGASYSVLLTCKDPGSSVNAYPSNETQTGFTVTTKTTSGAYVAVSTVTVYWLVLLKWND